MTTDPENTRALCGNDVVIVIVNFNSGGHLRRCLDALHRQTVSPGRILVVDNASTDDSLEHVADRFPKVIIERMDRNVGFATANNVAIRTQDSWAWVALLNPDAYPEPGWLEELLSAAARNPSYSGFGSRMIDAVDKNVFDGTGDVYHVSGLAWRAYHGRPSDDYVDGDCEIFSPCAAAALYRADALRDVDGFDEDYFCYFEDVDLGFRLRLAGYRCLYVSRAVVSHVGSATTGRNSEFSIYYGHRNLVWTYFKNMPGALLWIYLPQHLLLNLITVIYYCFHRRARIIWRSKLDAIKEMRTVWKKRRVVQRTRRVSNQYIRDQFVRGIMKPYVGRGVVRTSPA